MANSKVVGFYHGDGLVPSWKLAQKFAGEGGRIATLPDIIKARLNNIEGDIVWEKWFTTNSAEYFGLGKDGNQKIIIAHGIGPMSTLDGVLKAYSHEYKDKTRNNRGGRISQQEFWDLESGKYGSVEVIDFKLILEDFHSEGIDYPFSDWLNITQSAKNRLLLARLGPNAQNYLIKQYSITSRWLSQENIKNKSYYQPIIVIGDADNCGYLYHPLEKDLAFAHLICIDRLTHRIQSGNPSLITDIRCHEWWNGTRFVGIKKNTIIKGIDKCVDGDSLLEQHWEKLMIPNDSPPNPRALMNIMIFCNKMFTMYPKLGGRRLDTGEPEFKIVSLEPIGEPMEFITKIGGYELFFRYDLKEVKDLAPKTSNTYQFIEEPVTIYKEGNTGGYHKTKIQFFRAEIDYSHRLMRSSQLANDYDLMIELIDK